MELAGYFITACAGYLLGSIPTGYLAGRARGIDIRTVGSGNIGATNVFRALGTTAGILVLLVDAAKGFVSCWCVARAVAQFCAPDPAASAELVERLSIAGGVAAILGHNYTCWLHWKGGKGVATTAGVLLALFPQAFLISLGLWLLVLGISRYVSLASMAAAASLPLVVWLVGGSRTLILVAGCLGLLAIYKHKSNIQRLLDGTEHRFGRKKTQEEAQ